MELPTRFIEFITTISNMTPFFGRRFRITAVIMKIKGDETLLTADIMDYPYIYGLFGRLKSIVDNNYGIAAHGRSYGLSLITDFP